MPYRDANPMLAPDRAESGTSHWPEILWLTQDFFERLHHPTGLKTSEEKLESVAGKSGLTTSVCYHQDPTTENTINVVL